MIHFVGTSYAALTLKEAARRRGLKITDHIKEADLIFISEDTPTDEKGNRDIEKIKGYVHFASDFNVPVILTSQVEPGFCKSIKNGAINFYHQAETLRIEDGMQRAMYPEMFIIGMHAPYSEIHPSYKDYLETFDCPILKMTFEEAEFTKIAINAFLISQVETTNMLSEAAKACGADWATITQALRKDSRIGKFAYLTPGQWHKSKHLLRDFVTLTETIKSKLLDAWK